MRKLAIAGLALLGAACSGGGQALVGDGQPASPERSHSGAPMNPTVPSGKENRVAEAEHEDTTLARPVFRPRSELRPLTAKEILRSDGIRRFQSVPAKGLDPMPFGRGPFGPWDVGGG